MLHGTICTPKQVYIQHFQQILLIYANYIDMKVWYNFVVVCAGLVFEISGVILFILAFLVPVGWPLLVALLVLWLGPWLVSYSLAYSYASSSGSEPLIES
jgi:hypothetical protein